MNGDYVRLCHEDLTLRDYFAARAMQAIIGESIRISPAKVSEALNATWAYKQADAMLAARGKEVG